MSSVVSLRAQLSVISYQFSVFSYQFSVFSLQSTGRSAGKQIGSAFAPLPESGTSFLTTED